MPSHTLTWTRPLTRLTQRLHLSWRGVVETAIVASALIACDPTPVSLGVGGVVSAVGELLRIVTNGYGYSIGELSMRGPYRFVRHPHFLGNALLFFGLAIAARSVYVMGFALVAMAVLYRFEVRADERRLMLRLGPRFADYRARVPAFLPLVWPPAPADHDNRTFSLRNALFAGRHREFNAAVGLAAAFGMLYLASVLPARDVFQLVVLVIVGLYILGRFVYYGAVKRTRR